MAAWSVIFDVIIERSMRVLDECFEAQGWEGVEDWMGPSSNESNLADYTIRGGVTEV